MPVNHLRKGFGKCRSRQRPLDFDSRGEIIVNSLAVNLPKEKEAFLRRRNIIGRGLGNRQDRLASHLSSFVDFSGDLSRGSQLEDIADSDFRSESLLNSDRKRDNF